jgi:hypothetical protein
MPCRLLQRLAASLLPGLAAAWLVCASSAFSAPDNRTGDRPTRLEIWDLRLGSQIEQLPDEFIDYACGTNGGPPSTPLNGWREVRRCRPEGSGLREVYFRYDDELEYWAKANNLLPQMEQYSGTKSYGFPVTVSALIDDGGACERLPPDDGETPVEGIFVKERCRKDLEAKTAASLTTRHLRKAGQSQFDPRTGRETAGQFESSVRFELVQK